MPLRSTLAPELPFLRRYARAATGSQQMGDAAVREMLEALLEAPEEFDTSRPPRLELYRIFHRLWQPDRIAVIEPRPTARLRPTDRYALMLTAVEGFSTRDAAEILGESEPTVTAAIERARDAIARDLSSTVMVIEDEPIIALHIRSIVEELGHKVCGIARTRDEARDLAARSSPELVLADISLADGSSGIDAAQDILAAMDVPVIFVTAYPERLLTGERPEPTYLITKPFEDGTLGATIGQALMFHRERVQVPSPLLS